MGVSIKLNILEILADERMEWHRHFRNKFWAIFGSLGTPREVALTFRTNGTTGKFRSISLSGPVY